MESDLNEFEDSLSTTSTQKIEKQNRLRKQRSRTKSADLSAMRDSEIPQEVRSTAKVNYNSDHGLDLSTITRDDERSEDDHGAADFLPESSPNRGRDKQATSSSNKSVGKLCRTLSEKLRRENRIAAPVDTSSIPVDDSVHKAIRQGLSLKQLMKHFKKMSHVDQRDSKGQSCLHLCAARGEIEAAKHLLKRGANINFQDNCGFTPLHYSAIEQYLDTTALLLTVKDIDVRLTTLENANVMHYLVRVSVTEDNSLLYREIIDTLIAKGIDINAPNIQGEAPIHFACMKSNIHTVAFLLGRGADCNAPTNLGETPLHYAIRADSIKLVRLLMENGADPTIPASDNSTPVDVAEAYRLTEILDCLQAIIEEDIECANKDQPSAIVSSRSRARESNVPHSGGMEILNKDGEWQRCWTVLRGQRILCYPDRTETGEPIVRMHIENAKVQAEDSQQTPLGELWCFSVATTAEQRVLFGTKAPEIRDQWVVTLVGTVDSRSKLCLVYEKLKTLSKPRKRLRRKERNLTYHNCMEGTRVLIAACKSRSSVETLRLLTVTVEESAACLSEVIDPDDEPLIRNFVKFFLHHGLLLDFLRASLTHDIRKATVGETLFREMSLSTRMLSIYLEMDEGREYLRSVALDLLAAVSSVDHSLEVNPHHINPSERTNYKANLEKIVEISQKFLDRVLSSASRCPLIFRELMLHTKSQVDAVFPNMTHAVVGGFVFLRFLCPAIITPHKYGLLAKCPDKNVLRVCVLITKLLQSVSNGVEFDGSKEDYMLRLNPFIKRNRLYVNVFFDNLTSRQSIEQQKRSQGKRFFQLGSSDLQETGTAITEGIFAAHDKMLGLLTSSSHLSYLETDSDDENR